MTDHRKRNKDNIPELSALELEVMDVVWELGECSSAEVIAALARSRTLADTTVRTVLSNIRKKGYLQPVPSLDRGFRLRPTVSREAVARRSLGKLVSKLFRGSAREAIAYLIDDRDISDDELDAIRHMIDQHKTTGGHE
jgi:predicted transcriptional regulator